MKLKELIPMSKVKIGSLQCIILSHDEKETLLHDTVSGEIFSVDGENEVVKE